MEVLTGIPRLRLHKTIRRSVKQLQSHKTKLSIASGALSVQTNVVTYSRKSIPDPWYSAMFLVLKNLDVELFEASTGWEPNTHITSAARASRRFRQIHKDELTVEWILF